jgi:putative FmdB family regulatory protein
MPLYEYHCDDCAKEFELLVPNSRTEPDCPHCGGHKLTKLLSTFSSKGGSSFSASSSSSSGCCPCGKGAGSCSMN